MANLSLNYLKKKKKIEIVLKELESLKERNKSFSW